MKINNPILLLMMILLNQSVFGQNLHKSNIVFQQYPTVKKRQIEFTYSGPLSHFRGTNIELVYFQNQQLHVHGITISYKRNEIKGLSILPKNVPAFSLSVYNEQFGEDNNKEKGYIFCIYNNNKTVPGALFNKSLLLTSRRMDVSTRTYLMALKLQCKEFSIYPQLKQKYVLSHLKTLVNADSNNYKFVEGQLNRVLTDSLKGDVSELSLIKIKNLYATMHKKEMKDSVLQIILNRYTYGVSAASIELKKISSCHDPDSMVMMVHHFKKEFNQVDLSKNPLSSQLSYVYDAIAYQYFLKKNYPKLLHYLKLMHSKLLEATELVRYYTDLIYLKTPMSDSFIQSLSSEALQAISLARNQCPTDESQSHWNSMIKHYYPSCVDIHAKALAMNGHLKEAIRAEKSILPFNSGYTGNFNRHYLDYINQSGNEGLLLKEARDIYVQNRPCPGIDSVLQVAYYNRYTSDKNKYLAFKKGLDSLSQLNRIKSLRNNMLNIKAPLFTLEDLKGNQVSLSELKGKIVVLDFWATWCTPCISSFVGMKKLKTKYQHNNNVVFLFIDKDESTPDKQKRIEKVKKFLESKNYRFHVLLDGTKGENIASLYRVMAIPTRVLIDKNGFIQFMDKGYSGDPGELEKNLKVKIDFLENM